MSFSGDVKKELHALIPDARHCQIAELRALTGLLRCREEEADDRVFLKTESEALQNRVFTLVQKAFNIKLAVAGDADRPQGTAGCLLEIRKEDKQKGILQALRHRMVLGPECCRRAYLRAAFLASGSISAPEKYYHLEVVAQDADTAEEVQSVMKSFALDAKTVRRKHTYVVYLKEGEQIVRALGEMGAGVSLLKLESIRVTREVKGNINRKVNCETANIRKTIVSSHRQIEDIAFLKGRKEFSELPAQLREMAEIRLQYPDDSLAELGGHLNPRIGKSGVNHRLRKISEIVANLREKDTV
ncbi:MAG: DNA-binding protein WhiA [Lachnospiraceae bacterium]|nr:DNA-binding protein WhiA [Lachnospiraceae bacterium]